LIKALAHEAGIAGLYHRNNETKIYMYPKAKVVGERIDGLLKKYRNAMRFAIAEVPMGLRKNNPGMESSMPQFSVKTKCGSGFDLIKCEKIVIKDIKALLETSESGIIEKTL